jgi:uncharacterized protein YdhG (YjbR/CyaY superfamily)
MRDIQMLDLIGGKGSVKPKTVEEYILFKPAEVQERLNELRAYLIEADPDAIDELKWGKPALVNNGILYVYAAAKNHISLHPTPSVISHLKKELGSRISSENTIRFSINEPIPRELVNKVANQRAYEKETMGIKWK